MNYLAHGKGKLVKLDKLQLADCIGGPREQIIQLIDLHFAIRHDRVAFEHRRQQQLPRITQNTRHIIVAISAIGIVEIIREDFIRLTDESVLVQEFDEFLHFRERVLLDGDLVEEARDQIIRQMDIEIFHPIQFHYGFVFIRNGDRQEMVVENRERFFKVFQKTISRQLDVLRSFAVNGHDLHGEVCFRLGLGDDVILGEVFDGWKENLRGDESQ